MTGSVGDDPKPTEYGSTHAVLIKRRRERTVRMCEEKKSGEKAWLVS
jgi:hypothetical protein